MGNPHPEYVPDAFGKAVQKRIIQWRSFSVVEGNSLMGVLNTSAVIGW